MRIRDFISTAEASLAGHHSLASLCDGNQIAVEALGVGAWCSAGVTVDVIRADLVDPIITGNKWFKLKYHLLAASAETPPRLLSFGGAWSNHLHALAQAAQRLEWSCTGVIRGQELDANSNPTLRDLAATGMHLRFVSRQQYRLLSDLDSARARAQWPGYYVIPAGGIGWTGAAGSASLLRQLHIDWSKYDALLLAVGTGCTLAGIAAVSPVPVWGVPAVRGERALDALATNIKRLLMDEPEATRWRLLREYGVTRFGPAGARAQARRREVQVQTGVEFDAIYGARVLDAIFDMIMRKTLSPGSRILLLHSGGIQGNRGDHSEL